MSDTSGDAGERSHRLEPPPRRRGSIGATTLVVGLASLLAAAPMNAQEASGPRPRTRAERTGYRETSRYADVTAFLDSLAPSSTSVRRLPFGYTHEGRSLPLVAWDPEGGEPASGPALPRRGDDRVRVLVLANIHAGEVEGKEASLILLRELVEGARAEWSDSLLLLFAPIYNADGNERIALDNRPLQYGPIGGMGQRPNAQGYDLNRDFMKLDPPKARSLAGALRDVDPHVVIDLHTTNGTVHAYHLTYSPPLHPDTDTEIDRYLREQQQLTAVERFSQRHDADLVPAQERYYRDLIPLARPTEGQQYAFEVDLDSCSGCKACVTACHQLNGLDDNETWRDVGALHGGSESEPFLQHVTAACHHCLEPACLACCPVRAYEKDPATGIVRHLDDQCIGCQYCIFACPYDVPRYDKARGIVRKCDLCSQRLAVDEAPACVQACPNSAIRVTTVRPAPLKAGG